MLFIFISKLLFDLRVGEVTEGQPRLGGHVTPHVVSEQLGRALLLQGRRVAGQEGDLRPDVELGHGVEDAEDGPVVLVPGPAGRVVQVGVSDHHRLHGYSRYEASRLEGEDGLTIAGGALGEYDQLGPGTGVPETDSSEDLYLYLTSISPQPT